MAYLFNKYILRFLFSVLLIIESYAVYSQQVYSRLERDSMYVGEQIFFEFGISYPSDLKVLSYTVFDSDTLLKNIEIISRSITDTIIEEKITKIKHNYCITSFDTGIYVIPPLQFLYISDKDTVANYTDSLYLRVLLVDADTTKNIMDIKGLWGVPFQWTDYLWHLVVLLLIILLAISLLYYFMRRRRGLPLFPSAQVKIIPPDEEALSALDKIKKEKIWQKGLVKEYHTQITDVIRLYIERIYNISAPEYTSAETVNALTEANINNEAINKVQHIFFTADIVKFAKAYPPPTENENCLILSYDFVNITRPIDDNQPKSEK